MIQNYLIGIHIFYLNSDVPLESCKDIVVHRKGKFIFHFWTWVEIIQPIHFIIVLRIIIVWI